MSTEKIDINIFEETQNRIANAKFKFSLHTSEDKSNLSFRSVTIAIIDNVTMGTFYILKYDRMELQDPITTINLTVDAGSVLYANLDNNHVYGSFARVVNNCSYTLYPYFLFSIGNQNYCCHTEQGIGPNSVKDSMQTRVITTPPIGQQAFGSDYGVTNGDNCVPARPNLCRLIPR